MNSTMKLFLQQSSRIGAVVLALGLAGAAMAAAPTSTEPQSGAVVIETFHETKCQPCDAWEGQLKAAGFTVRRSEVLNVAATRRWLAVPENFASFITSRVGGYIIEGPVPAAHIRQLLKDKPVALGLALPGNPAAPGAPTQLMFWGGRSDPFASQ
jgi:hypothetical protein